MKTTSLNFNMSTDVACDLIPACYTPHLYPIYNGNKQAKLQNENKKTQATRTMNKIIAFAS